MALGTVHGPWPRFNEDKLTEQIHRHGQNKSAAEKFEFLMTTFVFLLADCFLCGCPRQQRKTIHRFQKDREHVAFI
jgi:hypothetical protein